MVGKWPSSFPGVAWFGEEEEKAVLDVVRTGSVFRYYGPATPRHVKALEETAERTYGVRHALAVNSGTGALFTAMTALGIGPGQEVIVPAFLWVSTVGAVVTSNAIPVVCEVDESWCMDPADLERRITPRTALIVAVHMAGTPCDMGSIVDVARRRGIPVLEDCAQCNGGSWRGRMVGTFGRIGMYSLQINKNCTAGEGGLVVTDDDALFERLIAAHDVGVPWKGAGTDDRSATLTWGAGRRLGELSGAVGAVQLAKLPRIVEHMRASKARMLAGLDGLPDVRLRKLNDAAGDTGAFIGLIFATPEKARRAVAVMNEAGIGGAIVDNYGMHVTYNIPQLVRKVPLSAAGNPWSLAANAASVYEYGKDALPATSALFERSVIMAVPSRLTPEQEDYAAGVLRRAVKA